MVGDSKIRLIFLVILFSTSLLTEIGCAFKCVNCTDEKGYSYTSCFPTDCEKAFSIYAGEFNIKLSNNVKSLGVTISGGLEIGNQVTLLGKKLDDLNEQMAFALKSLCLKQMSSVCDKDQMEKLNQSSTDLLKYYVDLRAELNNIKVDITSLNQPATVASNPTTAITINEATAVAGKQAPTISTNSTIIVASKQQAFAPQPTSSATPLGTIPQPTPTPVRMASSYLKALPEPEAISVFAPRSFLGVKKMAKKKKASTRPIEEEPIATPTSSNILKLEKDLMKVDAQFKNICAMVEKSKNIN